MDVPLIDLAGWRAADGPPPPALLDGLDDAFSRVGFALIANHGVEAEVLDAVRGNALEFFRLDLDIKHKYEVGSLGDPGWVPSGLEANGYIFGIETPPDLKETYKAGEYPVWPDELPTFEPAVARCRAAMDELYESLMVAAASILCPENPELIAEPCVGAINTVNCNWYPARGDSVPLPGQWRIGPHTDFGMLTLLDRQPGMGGLEVFADEWIQAPYVPGSLTVNVGDLLAMWSAGRWRSAIHRVAPPPAADPDEELLSIVVFCEARADTVIAPLPGTAPEHSFEPVTAGDYLDAKIRQITVG
jgi:isopenicillin N synthase-like dioxygenase